MADNVNIDRTNSVFAYDPAASSDLSLFNTITGTPSISSSKLRLNAATTQTKTLYFQGEFMALVTVPAAPTGGDARIWGFRSAGYTTNGSAYFEITGTTFRVVSYDDNGTAQTTNVTWASAYTNTPTEFRIVWGTAMIQFYASDVLLATHSTRMGRLPQPVYLRNANSDNMDFTYLFVRNAAQTFGPSSSTATGNTANSTSVTGFANTLPMARYNASPTARTEGQFGALQANAAGDLNVNKNTLDWGEDATYSLKGVLPKPIAGNTYTGTPLQNNSFTTTNLKATPGNVLKLSVVNTTASVRYLQLHNTATTPGGGATALYKFLVPANSQVILGPGDFGDAGIYFSTGIAYANSSVAATYTAGSAGDLLLDITYV